MGSLQRCIPKGIVNCERHDRILQTTIISIEQIKARRGSPLLTVLLEGPSGSGKTAMTATVGIISEFPYAKIISAEALIGLSERSKYAQIVKVFGDAYKSTPSLIVLDDIERLVEYAAVGSCYSNLICQTLMFLLKRLPPEGKRMMVIGTTSQVGFLGDVGIRDAFLFTYSVPNLNTEDAKKVLQHINVFSKDDVDAAAKLLNNMPIKRLYMVAEMAVEMAAQGKTGGSAEAIYSGKEKIDISHFIECLQYIGR